MTGSDRVAVPRLAADLATGVAIDGVVADGACAKFRVRAGLSGLECDLPSFGMRPLNKMAKWFRACFQPTIGIVYFFDASLIAR